MSITYIIVPNLALFDGAGAGAAASAASTAGAAAGVTEGGAAKAAPKKGGETVLYGKQPQGTPEAQPQAQATEPAAEKPEQSQDDARRTKYRDLVSGEFKDLYTEDVQRIIDRRFRQAKEAEGHLEKLRGIAERLAQRYGVDAADADALIAALDDDNDMWQTPADNAGMSVEQFKAVKKLERDNAALVQAEERRKGEEAAQATISKWQQEADALAAKVPGFDLRAEAQNPMFVSLLRLFTDNGFQNPVETAFKNVHMDEITTGAVQQAAAVTEQRITANIRARGNRPAEAGLGAQSGVVVKDDVSKLTKKDRAEIAQRAARGERITF